MIIARDIQTLKGEIARVKKDGLTVGLVPTMGALHAGHASLIRASCEDTDFTVVSIFVNPTQFAPMEDYQKYPRQLEEDAKLCEELGVGLVFAPADAEIYPAGFATYVTVEGLSKKLCGVTRPAHFRGVTTVVAKLFNLVKSDVAYFGQKDAQQALIIKKMVLDLHYDIRIEVCPTIRDEDGVAISSRNEYLSDKERSEAVCLNKALRLAKEQVKSGKRDASQIIKGMIDLVNSYPSARIDYVKIVGTDDLEEQSILRGEILIALAVYIGKTRLIDNVIIRVD